MARSRAELVRGGLVCLLPGVHRGGQFVKTDWHHKVATTESLGLDETF